MSVHLSKNSDWLKKLGLNMPRNKTTRQECMKKRTEKEDGSKQEIILEQSPFYNSALVPRWFLIF